MPQGICSRMKTRQLITTWKTTLEHHTLGLDKYYSKMMQLLED